MPASVVAHRQGVEHRLVAGGLHVRAQRGLDGEAAVVDLLLGEAERAGQVLQQVGAEEAADGGVDAAVRRVRPLGDGDRLRRDLGELLVGDVPEGVHAGQHLVAPGRRVLRVDDRVVVGGALHQAGEHGRLREGEVRGVHAEVLLRGGLDAVGALAEVHDVQVPGEDLVLGVGLLQGEREPGLPQLAADGLLVRRLPVLRRRRRLQQGLLDQLLGERRATLLHRAGRHVPGQRAQRALHVEAVVVVEAGVLDVDQRLLHDVGDLVGGHRRAVVGEEVGDQRPVGREHRGCCRPASCRSARPAGRPAARPSCAPRAPCRPPRAAGGRRAVPRRRRSSRRASRSYGSEVQRSPTSGTRVRAGQWTGAQVSRGARGGPACAACRSACPRRGRSAPRP